MKESKSKDIIIKNLNKKLLKLEKIIENKNNIIANLTTTNFNIKNNINDDNLFYNKIITEENNISKEKINNKINKSNLKFSIKKSIKDKDSFFNSDIEEDVINFKENSKIKNDQVMTLENLNESIKFSFINDNN